MDVSWIFHVIHFIRMCDMTVINVCLSIYNVFQGGQCHDHRPMDFTGKHFLLVFADWSSVYSASSVWSPTLSNAHIYGTVCMPVNVETRTHMHTHARTRTYAHTRTHTRHEHTHEHMRIRAHTHAHIHTRTNTRTHTRTRTHTHTDVLIHTQAQVGWRVRYCTTCASRGRKRLQRYQHRTRTRLCNSYGKGLYVMHLTPGIL